MVRNSSTEAWLTCSGVGRSLRTTGWDFGRRGTRFVGGGEVKCDVTGDGVRKGCLLSADCDAVGSSCDDGGGVNDESVARGVLPCLAAGSMGESEAMASRGRCMTMDIVLWC